MFPRPRILMDYPEDERIFFGGKNLELPQVLNSLTMIDLINCVRGSSSVLTAKNLRADIFPGTDRTNEEYLLYG